MSALDRKKYLRFSDLHLNLFSSISINFLIKKIKKENPEGVFITGDISSGPSLEFYLIKLAKNIKCNIYFVLGNHDYHKKSIQDVHETVKNICLSYKHMHWLTNSDPISLNSEVAIIGTEGWYDAKHGDPRWLRFTTDWILIEDFTKCKTLTERIEKFQDLSRISANIISDKLNKALLTHKTVFVLTHFPPWIDAVRDKGGMFENFWLPYNTNTIMGNEIEKIMKNKNKKQCIVLAGHTHSETWVRISRNIDCHVIKSSYVGLIARMDHIYI